MRATSIAILGKGCAYPGALSPQELWENVLAGRRYFRRSPAERLPDASYYDPDPDVIDKTYCNRMALLSGWSFNPTDWRIPPKTFEQCDIVQWLALSTAAAALEDARIDFDRTDRSRVGVIIGNSGIGEFHRSHLLRNRWPFVERAVRRAVEQTCSGAQADVLVDAIRHFYVSPFPEFREDHLAGNMANVIAGRIANYYDFRSASFTVDGACASSLLAVIDACQYLQMT
jgi:acyl transferase domain-containing protein